MGNETFESVLERLEKQSPLGLTSREILGFFEENGVAFSEATLRKYVQLGLLPRSVRVGQKGKHRGSKGMYPARVVRQVLLIKRMIAEDYTIEQIQREFLFLRGELEDLEETLDGVFTKLGQVVLEEGKAVAQGLSREVLAAETAGRDLMIRLRTLESRLMASRQNLRTTELQGAVG